MPLLIIYLDRKRDDFVSIQKVKRHLTTKAETVENILDECEEQ